MRSSIVLRGRFSFALALVRPNLGRIAFFARGIPCSVTVLAWPRVRGGGRRAFCCKPFCQLKNLLRHRVLACRLPERFQCSHVHVINCLLQIGELVSSPIIVCSPFLKRRDLQHQTFVRGNERDGISQPCLVGHGQTICGKQVGL